MNAITVTVVRIYITESSGLLKKIIKLLREEAKITGVSVFRAISGYGDTGSHGSSLVDLALDLPLAVEFFDAPEKISHALELLNQIVKPDHIIQWEAQANQA